MTRIGIDGRLGGLAHAGIGRYIENLLDQLPQLDDTYEWVYFLRDQSQLNHSPILARATRHPSVRVVWAPYKHYTLGEQWHLPAIFKQANLDLLHVPHFNVPIRYSDPTVITIHDLLWHQYQGLGVTTLPSWLYGLKYLGYRFVTNHAVAAARRIIVPTQSVKTTLTSYYPPSVTKTTVIKEGVGDAFSSQLKHPLASPFAFNPHRLLYVGSLYPHKNLEIVFQFLRQAPQYSLTVVGARSAFQAQVKDRAQKLAVDHQISWVGFVEDEQLVKLYRSAAALIQPSLSEGFGLTGVEAMAVGTPVIASQIDVFQEIYGDAAIFFDPRSVASLVQAITTLTPTIRQGLVKRGRAVVKEYSWQKMARETLEVYKRVLSR